VFRSKERLPDIAAGVGSSIRCAGRLPAILGATALARWIRLSEMQRSGLMDDLPQIVVLPHLRPTNLCVLRGAPRIFGFVLFKKASIRAPRQFAVF